MLLCLCGEYGLRTLYTFMIWGSSPHMRGIQKSKPKKHICSGFIPTHAGNIRPTAGTWCLLRVHPRPRGEYFYISAFYTSTKGSSPLARGILKQARTDSDMARFTPAYAGKRLKKSHKIGLRQFAKRPVPLTSQIRQRSKSNPPRPGAHRKHPSQNVQQASSAYNL